MYCDSNNLFVLPVFVSVVYVLRPSALLSLQ